MAILFANVLLVSLATTAAAKFDRAPTGFLQVNRSRQMSSYYNDLWDGMDVSAGGKSTYVGSATAKVQFKVMGMFNTGTNLLTELLKRNFPDANVVSGGPGDGCSFWKHSSLPVLKQHSPLSLNACKNDKIVGLTMIRNPMSWLRSMKHRAYNLHACTLGSNWLERPCTFPASTPSFLGGKRYDNIESIWSSWTGDYELLALYGFDNNLLIKYEELVEDTTTIFNKIAALTGLQIPDYLEQVHVNMAPGRNHELNARQKALEKIRTKSYLSQYHGEQIYEACTRLDKSMMHKHGYNDC